MKLKLTLLTITFALMQHAARGDTIISGGPVTGLWSLANSPYIVQSNISVPPGGQLTLEPGVIVKFDANVWISIAGCMVAQGTLSNLITFTSSASLPVPGAWSGIQVTAGGPRTIFDHVDVAFAVYGITVEGNNAQVTISNGNVHDCSYSGVVVDVDSGEYIDATDVIISRNRIHDCNYGVWVRAYGLTPSSRAAPAVDQNEIYDNTYGAFINAVRLFGFGSVNAASASPVFTRNFVHRNGIGIIGGATQYASMGGSFLNNLIVENTGNGIEMGNNSYPGIVNNTIVRNQGAGLAHSTFFRGTFRNNIVFSNSVGLRSDAPFTPATNQFALNNVAANIAVNWSNYPATYGSVAATNLNGTAADSEGNISTEPQFVTGGDYRLQPTSACVNAGLTDGAPLMDYNGNTRFNPPDIGAFEVAPYLRLGFPIRTNNSTLLRISAQAVRVFSVESSTNLVSWTNIAVLTNYTGSLDFTDASSDNAGRRFYRARPQ